MLAAQSDETLLGDRNGERTVAPEDFTTIEAARTRRRGTVLHIKQPLVGTERPMKPHRVIETRELQVRSEEIVTMGSSEVSSSVISEA